MKRGARTVRRLAAAGALVFAAEGGASALEFHPQVSGRGWFFSASGTIENQDLSSLGFDGVKGQPEIRAGFSVARRHHLESAFLFVRRTEAGPATVNTGVFPVTDDVSLDLSVDYFRAHYGFSVLANSIVDLQPFIALAYLHERTNIVDRTTGRTTRSNESAVFPLPGLELVLVPDFPVHLRTQAQGIGTGRGHVIDVEGGVEARYSFVFGGLGYRHIAFLVRDDRGNPRADVRLNGVYIEGGVRF